MHVLQQPIDIDRYWRDGYLRIPGVFTAEEIADYRQRAISCAGQPGDLLSKEELADVVFEPRLVDAARQILGGPPVYFGFSSANHAVTEATASWHRDCADRMDFTAPDWIGRYTLLRFGIYLQDHRRYSGGLNVRPTSHMAATANTRRVDYIESEVGDLVVWSLRILHSGDGSRLRGPWSGNLDPETVGRLPAWARLPKHDRRIALFVTYALDGDHLEHYIEYLKGREFMIRMWQTSADMEPFRERAAESGLLLRNVRREL